MATSFRESLAILAKARFPILYVETYEERRLLNEIRATMEQGGHLSSPRPVHVWSMTTGLVDPAGRTSPGTTDPLRALDAAHNTDQAATFVFLDFHAHLGDGSRPANPGIVRKLREVALAFQDGFVARTLVIVAPTLRIPSELEKDVHVLDFPLPDAVEIRRILDVLVYINAGSGRLRTTLTDDDKDRLVRAALGLTESEAEGALALAMTTDGVLSTDDVDTVLQEKKQAVRKSGLLEYVDTDVDLDDVGGLDDVKDWLVHREGSWLPEAAEYGIPAPRGVLLVGPPGCGKSTTARAVAGSWRLPLLRLDSSRAFSDFRASGGTALHKALRIAETVAPAVLWVDEIERAFAGGAGRNDPGTVHALGTFLNWMREKTAPVFVVVTSDDVRALPPAVLRGIFRRGLLRLPADGGGTREDLGPARVPSGGHGPAPRRFLARRTTARRAGRRQHRVLRS